VGSVTDRSERITRHSEIERSTHLADHALPADVGPGIVSQGPFEEVATEPKTEP